MSARGLPRLALLVAAALATLAPAAAAQGGAADTRRLVFTGVEGRGLSFDAGLGVKSVSEFVVPVGLVWPLSSRLTVDLGTRFASATREAENGGSTSLSGLTDFQARAVYEVAPERILVTVSANLPTGKTSLAAEELPVAGVVASDLIPFPVSSFGSGFNVTTGLAVAVPVAGWAVGAAGSYRLSGGYTPLADVDSSYKAGGEMRLRLGADRIVGQGRVSLGFTYSSFADDEFGGAKIFQSGSRYISQVSWAFPIGNLGLNLYLWDLYRSAGTALISGARTDKQNVLAAGAAASVQMGRRLLRPWIEFRDHRIGEPALQAGGSTAMRHAGTLLSFGARFQMPLGERYTLVPAVRFDTGNIASGGVNIGFSGWGLSAGLRASL